MPINMKNMNPPTRFYWEEPKENEEGEYVDLRLAPNSVQNDFRKKCGIALRTEYRETKKRGVQRLEYVDADQAKLFRLNDMLVDYNIVDWNLKDTEGNEIECSAENKLLLIKNHPPFENWFNDKMDFLENATKEQAKKEIENL